MCGICFCLYTDTEVSGSYFQVRESKSLFDLKCQTVIRLIFCIFMTLRCVLKAKFHSFQALSDSILPYLARRGPDRRGRKELYIKNDQRTVCLTLTSTILHLRGKMTPQPLIDEFGNILCWNGEIFGGIKVT